MANYNVNGIIKSANELSYNDLIWLVDNYYIKNNGKYFNSHDFKAENNLPSPLTVKKILKQNNMTFQDLLSKYEKRQRFFYDEKYFDYYVDLFKKYSNERGRYLSINELKTYNLPNFKWFLKYCPDKNIVTWTDFLFWCGYIPIRNRLYSNDMKQYIINSLIELEEKISRPIKVSDITVTNVGFSIYEIYRYWDNISNCKKEIGLIDDESFYRNHSWEYFDKTMTEAIETVKSKIDTDIITWEEFKLLKENSISKNGFKEACSREGIDMYDYFEQHGLKLCVRNSLGFIYKYSDGELCLSTYEKIFSNYLRELDLKYNFDYKRSVLYRKFVNENIQEKYDCDYLIKNMFCIEICGLIRNINNKWREYDYSSEIQQKYREKMLKKEKYLVDNNFNYLFLFANDFSDNTYKEKTDLFFNELWM